MFAEAFASLAADISAAIGGPFFDAVARWPGTPVYDLGGSILTPGAPVAVDCQCQVDVATEAMRLADGFVDTDVRLLVPVASLAAVLDTSAVIEVLAGPAAGRWSVLSIARDPVGVCWDCRGRRAG